MSLLRSKAIRVLYSRNGTLTDFTEECRTWGAPNATMTFIAAQDAIYIGKPHKFNNLYIAMATPSSATSTMTINYWSPGKRQWVPFINTLDETNGLKASGFIQWEEPADSFRTIAAIDWFFDVYSNITGLQSLTAQQDMFWIKITFSADLSAGTSIRAIKTLFSDDRMMTVVHPEIMSYLPAGQTDYLPQHEAAKDAIVNFLKVKGLIDYEEQLKNPDDWMWAATHKCIEIILKPISGDERLNQIKKEMSDAANSLMIMSSASIDRDQNENLTRDEREPGVQRHLTR